ncbi:MAG: hypothetical protein EZS28_010420 [Streblomastix strix]|uniref:Uncharacterized protein n=1 Tax=Streblomastix strix TaxID=222440 RepID=A0A5J4WGI5_9EUKA|nr:MAG: hypothetical protein EZS28_010420 [Streblomastix strix]
MVKRGPKSRRILPNALSIIVSVAALILNSLKSKPLAPQIQVIYPQPPSDDVKDNPENVQKNIQQSISTETSNGKTDNPSQCDPSMQTEQCSKFQGPPSYEQINIYKCCIFFLTPAQLFYIIISLIALIFAISVINILRKFLTKSKSQEHPHDDQILYPINADQQPANLLQHPDYAIPINPQIIPIGGNILQEIDLKAQY